jgi:UDP-glucose 4-epimerase
MAKAIVTGAAGFIGSHVAHYLLKNGIEVIALDDLSGGFLENVPPGARFVKGSITDFSLLKQLFETERFDYVYHLAAYAAEGLSHFIRRFNYDNNLLGSVNFINLSILYGIRCLVFTSSIAVYGSNQLPMTEDLTPQPEDPYGVAKYAVELDLRAAQHQFGLNSVVFRPHNVYGEHQNIGDKYRNVIGIFMNQILSNQPLTIFGDGEQTRAFTYIDEVAPVIAGAGTDPNCYNQVFNIGGDQPYTVNELVRVVSEAMGAKPEIRHLPARQEVKHAFSSHDKIRKFFNLPVTTPLREGVAKMAAWVDKVGSRKTQDFAAIEIPYGLPEGW